MSEIFSMTNSTKLIELDKKKYILRIPGIGTDKLIDRQQEYEVYTTIAPYNISDKVLFFDKYTGIKITKFIENCHNVNPRNMNDVKLAMNTIRHLHSLKLRVDFEFNLKDHINFYEELMIASKYKDYNVVKNDVMFLLNVIDDWVKERCLCHIDPNQDNILIDNNTNQVKALIDWEYAAMQDPLVDVAMFCIYAGYNKVEIDKILSLYYEDVKPSQRTYALYYTYIAACGLLWSNWCEYKNHLGQSFGGTYEQSQYDYAKQFSKLARGMVE